MPKTSFDFVFLRRHSQSGEAALSSLCHLYILANLLGNERPLFVICDWWIAIRFVCFKGRCFVFEKHGKFNLSSKFC